MGKDAGNMLGRRPEAYTDIDSNETSETESLGISLLGQTEEDIITPALYSYNGKNQMVEAKNGDSTVTNTFNAEGLRAAKAVDDVTTYYCYEYSQVIKEVDSSGSVAYNVYGTNLISRELDGQKVYYLYNGHGDVTGLLSSTGAVIASYYYDAFGVIVEQNGNFGNPYRYAGYMYDEESSLYNLNARFYDAKLARFMQEDTYLGNGADPLSLNLYAYCNNNPLIYYDPTGHKVGDITTSAKGITYQEQKDGSYLRIASNSSVSPGSTYTDKNGKTFVQQGDGTYVPISYVGGSTYTDKNGKTFVQQGDGTYVPISYLNVNVGKDGKVTVQQPNGMYLPSFYLYGSESSSGGGVSSAKSTGNILSTSSQMSLPLYNSAANDTANNTYGTYYYQWVTANLQRMQLLFNVSAQSILSNMGFDVGGIDGKIGLRTSSAVILTQNYMNIPVTGIVTSSYVKSLQDLYEKGVKAEDIMKHYRESWKPEKPLVDKSDPKYNGYMSMDNMARLPNVEGTDTYIDRSAAVAWAVLIQDVMQYNKTAKTADQLNLNCFLPKGDDSGYRSYHMQVEAYGYWMDPGYAALPVFDIGRTEAEKQLRKYGIKNDSWNWIPDSDTESGAKLAGYGTSNHSWGLALDFNMSDSKTGVATSKELKWLEIHASMYGFSGYINTASPKIDGKPNYKETWHWNYDEKVVNK